MAVNPVVYDDSTKKHRPLGSGEKMDGLSASSIISSQTGNLITTGSDGLAYATGSGIADPAADNLIEATSGGKLKVDMDRVVDWLDGHSSDASALADAINVVSGDSGNVIAEGTDNGAYLSKAVLANAIGSMSDAQLQSLAAAIADGQTIVASGGKLIVDPTNATDAKLKKITAVLPKDQGGIVADSSTGKLYVDFDAMSAATKRDIVLSMVDLEGGLAVHPANADPAKAGKIYVDFTAMDDDIMKDVVMKMVDLEGGLAVYQSGAKKGKLYVDFENMPTAKFEKMMKDLKMQIPLEANLHQYVATDDPQAGDSAVDGRGTEAKPWKTIQACVTYVTTTYSLNTHIVYIHVKAGTYVETVNLPRFDATSGYISIFADSGAQDVIIESPVSSGGVPSGCIAATGGGTWRLENLHLVLTVSPVALNSYTARSLLGSGDKSVVALYGIHFDQRVVSGAITGSTMDVRVCNADSGGTIRLRHGSLPHKFSLSVADITGLSVEAIRCARGSDIVFYRTEADAASHGVECTGSCTTFAYVVDNSNFHSMGTGSRLSFTGAGGATAEVTGKRYTVSGGSYVNLGVGADYFPGDTAGTVDNGEGGRPQTYCWYS